MKPIVLLLLMCALPVCASDAPYLVKDFPGSLDPRSSLNYRSFWTTLGQTSWFAADSALGAGMQVWKTDGTTDGTIRVTDVLSRQSIGHAVEFLGVVNNRLIYWGYDLTDQALFALDVNGGAPVVIARTPSWSLGVGPGVVYNGLLYFAANSVAGVAQKGAELWHTDGTPSGTGFLDLNHGSDSSMSDVYLAGGWLVFPGETAAGKGILRTDGTEPGTTLLAAMQTPAEEGIRTVTQFGSRIVFLRALRSATDELWITDGTSEGTRAIATGLDDFRPLRVVENKLLFTMRTSGKTALWATDGSVAGTRELATLPGEKLASLTEGDVVGTKYLFFADDDATEFSDHALYSIGSTPGSLTKVATGFHLNGNGGVGSAWNGRLYFSSADPILGSSWWSSDGTAAGTHKVEGFSLNPMSGNWLNTGVARPDGLLIGMNGSSGLEPWIFTGEAGGSRLLKNIAADIPSPGSNPRGLRAGSDTLFFFADDLSGLAVGTSDGTPAHTTIDLVPASGSFSFYKPLASGNRYYQNLVLSSSVLLYSTDGTTSGTEFLTEHAGESVPVDGGIVFEEIVGQAKIFHFSDGTVAGTRVIEEPASAPSNSNSQWTVYAADGLAWFVRGYFLAVSDHGSPMRLIRSEDSGTIANVVEGPGGVYFTDAFTADFKTSHRLWRTDGTTAGTWIVKTLPTPELPSVQPPHNFAASATRLFFTYDSVLWSSDGTEANTIALPGLGPDSCSDTAALGNQLFWYATGTDTVSIKKSDGTVAGTMSLATFPRTFDEPCFSMAAFRDRVYFRGFDSEHFVEPWVTDGTVAGTQMLMDIYPGANRSSFPAEFTTAAGHLFFTADSPDHGRELWAIGDRPRRRAAGH